MFSITDILAAGRKALGLANETPQEMEKEVLTLEGGQTAQTVTRTLAEEIASTLDNRPYRVTFKNGCGMDVDGYALKHNFCLDAAQIETIEPA